MEPKKIKKLVIHKETISALNDFEQSRHKGGGTDSGIITCLNYTYTVPFYQYTWEKWTCIFCDTVGEFCFPTRLYHDCPLPTPSGWVSICVC